MNDTVLKNGMKSQRNGTKGFHSRYNEGNTQWMDLN